jgi:hypothetical protein
MDDLLNKPAPSPESQPKADAPLNLQEQVESIRQLAISALILMLVIACTFDLYLYRQFKNENSELSAAHAQVDPVMANWQKNEQPAIDNFLHELTKYGQSHQDIGQLLAKYNLKPQAGTGAASPVTPTGTGTGIGGIGAAPAKKP